MRKDIENLLLFLLLCFSISLTLFTLNIVKKHKNTVINKINNTKIEDKDIQITFVGDLMFDRYIRQVGEVKGYDFVLSDVKNILVGSDLVIGNLEGPITDNKSVSIYSEIGSPTNYVFTMSKAIPKVLKDNNITIVNIGNNHILNFGMDGLNQTIKYLEEENIKYFGDIANTPINKTLIVNTNGITMGLVSFNQFNGSGVEVALENIKKLKEENNLNLIVVYAHWGNEYELTASSYYQDIAHQFIDTGANLIVGSHPHVVQQKETYKDKTIYYSLGNFIYDQYFDENVKQGLVIKLNMNTLTKNVSFKEINTKLDISGKTLVTDSTK